MPQLFDLLRVRHPHIHLNVAEGSSVQLEQQLASGQLDLAVVTFPLSGDEIMAAQLFDEDLVAVLPPGHFLGEESSIPLERLSDVELLLPAPGTALRAEIDSATGPARIVLRPAMELDGVRLIASLAFDGYGAGHPPGHRRAGPPAGAVLRAAGHRTPPPPGRRGAAAPRAALGPGAGGDRRPRDRGQRHALHARGHPPDLSLSRHRPQASAAGWAPATSSRGAARRPGSGTSSTTSNPWRR